MIKEDHEINYWPCLADIALGMRAILLIMLFVQFLGGGEAFKYRLIHENQEKMDEQIIQSLGDNYKQYININVNGNIQRIRFSDRILFERGEYELKEEGIVILADLAAVLHQNRKLYSQIQIEGHTDDIPIKTAAISDNWVLSSLRATSVVRFFTTPDPGTRENISLEAAGLSATGYGQYQPIEYVDPKATKEQQDVARAKNRRIEIVLIYSTGA